MQTQNSTRTAAETINALIKLKLDLIPLKVGGKVPQHAAWNVPVARHLSTVLASFGVEDQQITTEALIARHGNIGVLNETSRIVTLDCDSPLAGTALKAACAALKGDIGLLYPETSWTSVKGSKAMYRRPEGMQAGRVVFRIWKSDGTYDVIFELRGTGQDVLPPSYREDAQMRLAWFHEMPTKVPPMPKWLVLLNQQLAAGQGPAIDAMCAALKLTPEQVRRTHLTTHNMRGYPPALAAYPAEQAYINAVYDVAALLLEYGYQRVGKRWKPKDSSHAAGIVPPRDEKENWLCEHEGDPLAGVFDAWRVVVELTFEGNVKEAVESVRAEQRAALRPKQVADQPGGAEQEGEQQGEPEPEAPASPELHSVGGEPVGQGDDDDHQQEGGHSAGVARSVVAEAPGPTPSIAPGLDAEAEEVAAERASGQGDPGQVEVDQEARQQHGEKAQKKQQRGLHSTFLDEETQAIVPIIRGLLHLPAGMHLLSAMPKAGKSTLITAMSLTAATGVSFSGLIVDDPVTVLYCAFDESLKQNLQPRIQRLYRLRNLPKDLIHQNLTILEHPDQLIDWATEHHIDTQQPLSFEWVPDADMTDEEIAARRELLRSKFNPYSRALYHYIRHHRVKVCPIDVITKMRVRGQQGQSAYDRDLGEFAALNEIGIQTGCAIIGVHHMNKESAGKLAELGVHSLAKVSGTNAIAGAVQSIISMSRLVGRGVDQETLTAVEPKGAKIIIDQIARDSRGLEAAAFSLVATHLDGMNGPALEWVHMGPADILVGTDEVGFITEYLFDASVDDPNGFHQADAIFKAANERGIVAARSKDSFRKILQKLSTRGVLESVRGTGGGFRLSRHERGLVQARRDLGKY